VCVCLVLNFEFLFFSNYEQLIIKLKDIKNIIKDKTVKIIPNAITVVLENKEYFFTSFASRDKTYTTLFRVWQMALADSVSEV
jgi:type III secretory pathway lipoprotein EscJ